MPKYRVRDYYLRSIEVVVEAKDEDEAQKLAQAVLERPEDDDPHWGDLQYDETVVESADDDEPAEVL